MKGISVIFITVAVACALFLIWTARFVVFLLVIFSFREESDSVSETRDSSSDSLSDESESEKLSSRWDRCSSEEGDSFWHPNGRLGSLYFQYFEKSSPYGRVPLVDKVHHPFNFV